MEVEKSPFVFQTDSDSIKKALNSPNYIIEYSDTSNNTKDKFCVIYFSSNNIYYPNTKEEFQKSIVKKNKYEWYGSRIEKGAKHIFIRDIQKQWYLQGINNELNTIDKIISFLRSETEGYKIIMLGSSAGGYAAVLIGSILNADKILTFNGQFQLLDLLETSSEAVDPIVFRRQNDSDYNKYYSLKKYMKNPNSIFYFLSNKSSWDLFNKGHIEEMGVNIISYKTDNHGIPFVKSALPYVLQSSKEELSKLSGKSFDPVLFSIKYGGIVPTGRILFKKIKHKLGL